MEPSTCNPPRPRRVYVVTAWGSWFVAVVVAVVLHLWFDQHHGMRGERDSGVLLVYLLLLVASVVAFFAACISLVGVRSWRSAAVILPGALLGIGLNGFSAVV